MISAAQRRNVAVAAELVWVIDVERLWASLQEGLRVRVRVVRDAERLPEVRSAVWQASGPKRSGPKRML